MNEKVQSTLKSSETEDWLDYHFVRPLSYYCAVGFAKLGVHPNMVTIMSMIIGAASTYFYAHGCYYYEGMEGLVYNLIAIFLLIWADIYDCTDGQLARMTGKKSQMGRILDGAAGFVWFVPIYLGLVYRFYNYHEIEFSWLDIDNTMDNTYIATGVVFVLALISGFLGMGGQQRLADYYIQIHLFFLKGEKGSELDNSAQQQKLYDETPWKGNLIWKYFLKSYVGYTKKQEKATPEFQKLMGKLKDKYGSVDKIPAEVREEIHRNSLAIMKWNGLLTFNFRSGMFFIFCLLDIPVANFLFEIIGMSLLTYYINHRHEAFCKKIAQNL
ncbi:CDP-alcohol phosphatidyltransferase family protein [Segatella bryantii]|uniref:CDP-alcohol phosphatidyltransferase n=1 Tax=Segatella bryantii TaxID=77095 RepID=A0ABX4EGE9_SEGBR|nr:CDP-alcohol phosphatidyltransferase family protein [Segatella bryantii]OYP53688.1 CDP-alcohol phosphatidyltransferase [Segatella bryantii]UKK81758.1 CDP-alcohol phosphatidyltransferase family protein [Segatella bryantii]